MPGQHICTFTHHVAPRSRAFNPQSRGGAAASQLCTLNHDPCLYKMLSSTLLGLVWSRLHTIPLSCLFPETERGSISRSFSNLLIPL